MTVLKIVEVIVEIVSKVEVKVLPPETWVSVAVHFVVYVVGTGVTMVFEVLPAAAMEESEYGIPALELTADTREDEVAAGTVIVVWIVDVIVEVVSNVVVSV